MPYYRELNYGTKILKSDMLLITKSDAVYMANCMNAAYGDFTYRAEPRFLGYEGADYGVNYYHKFKWNDPEHISNNYAGYLTCTEMLNLCSDRSIVHQSRSWD